MHTRLISILFRLLFFAVILFSATSNTAAQQIENSFSPPGSVQYKDKITALEKYVVPKIYSDKSSQAWYDEILTDRNKGLLDAFKEDRVVYDTLLLNKCYAIFNKISAANKNFSFDTIRFYINRSIVANAACYGEGTIMVNLGLFLWVDNDDELALVLGHEISHQLLNHSESKIAKTIATLTSDDFKKELKSIKKADYGKYERYRNLMKGLSTESGKHSRYKESEADSLGVILLKNAGYNTLNASKILLKLDKVDDLFISDSVYHVKDYFEKTPADLSFFSVKPKYKGLSSMEVTMNADKDLDSIKTHPDCIKRYEAVAGKNSSAKIDCCRSLNDQYGKYKENAMMETVRSLYENNAIGLCVHLCLFALKNNYNPAFYNHFLSLCFSKLYYSDKNLERFNAVNSYASRGSNLKQLQDYLFYLNITDLEKLSAWFLNDKANDRSDGYEFASMMYNVQVKMKDAASAYADFKKNFPNSNYQYLIPKK